MTGAVRGSLWLFLVNLVGKGGQMAVTLVLAALLTEEGLGLVALTVSLVNIGQVVQSMGVYDVISRTGRDPRRMAGTLLVLSVGTGAALALALVAAADPIAAALDAPAVAPLIRLAALSLPFSAAAGVQLGLMHRDLDFRRRLLPDAGGAVLGAATTIVLAVQGFGPYALVYGLLCTAVAQPVLGAVAGVWVRPAWDVDAAVEAVRWIAVVGPGALVAVLLVNVDYLAIGRELGTEAVGVYSLAYRLAWVPYIMVAVVLGGVVFPLCAKLIRTGRRDELPQAAGRFTHAVLVVTGGLYAVTAALADRVVLFGDRWAPAALPLVLLCGYGLGFGLLHLWYQVIRAAGHARRYLALELAHLVALVVGLALCTRYGVVAVAATQLVVVWAMVPLAWIVLARNGIAPPGLTRMVAAVGAGVGCCLAAGWVFGDLFGPSLPGALGEAAVLVLGYTAAALPANRRTVRELREVRR
ncbi:oligosaccharide flippase family protein [Actinosynnema sp. NPDC047251]|uniref:Polysaccharide biosynthesis protein n=1 Tax=Saccharothrix espanaensis (strain ATCC 51144 / DSM 44229 / JCM 9112 / NBRC 15066 / NRRL 15764) TaxID=1179773 RepID=K0JZ15_SACES|nr:oligosaccharide flippase family protein [Saccharothrix espanaensis]CCH33205.1 Polysaccharide biosynthesis protein [Saccharothrix espanaensis DSM 44229]